MDQNVVALLIFYGLLIFSILLFVILGILSGKLVFEICWIVIDRKRAHQFYNSLIKLLQNNSTISDIIDTYIILFKHNEQDPIFIPKLQWLLKNFKVLLITEDGRYVSNDSGQVVLKEWKTLIDQWVIEIERKYPFSGLSKEDSHFFNDLNIFIEKGENEAAKKKLYELSKIFSQKNRDLKDMQKKTRHAYYFTILGVAIGLCSFIITMLR